jgi:hypothetical protein
VPSRYTGSWRPLWRGRKGNARSASFEGETRLRSPSSDSAGRAKRLPRI